MQKKQKTETTVNLSDCLSLFLKPEKLSPDDLWFCPQCKEQQQATKKFDLWNLPKIVVVHLKRFYYSRNIREKIEIPIKFPTEKLDLRQYVTNKQPQKTVYDLCGVVNHAGGLGGGHYTAFAKNKIDQKWYLFNDQSTKEVDDDTPITRAAYLLFYMQRSDDGAKR